MPEELTPYITQELDVGADPESIKADLLTAGWDASIVDEAIHLATTTKPVSKKIFVLFGILVILGALVVALLYFEVFSTDSSQIATTDNADAESENLSDIEVLNEACQLSGQAPADSNTSNGKSSMEEFIGFEDLLAAKKQDPFENIHNTAVYRVLSTKPLMVETLDIENIPDNNSRTFGTDGTIGWVIELENAPKEASQLNFNDIVVVKSETYYYDTGELAVGSRIVSFQKVLERNVPYLNATTSVSNRSGVLVTYRSSRPDGWVHMRLYSDGGIVWRNEKENLFKVAKVSQETIRSLMLVFSEVDFNSLSDERDIEKQGLSLYCSRMQGISIEKHKEDLGPLIVELEGIIDSFLAENDSEEKWITYIEKRELRDWDYEEVFKPSNNSNIEFRKKLREDKVKLPEDLMKEINAGTDYLYENEIYSSQIYSQCLSRNRITWDCVGLSKRESIMIWPQDLELKLNEVVDGRGTVPVNNYLNNKDFYDGLWNIDDWNVFQEGDFTYVAVTLYTELPSDF